MTEPNNYEARIVKLEANLEALANRQDEVHHYLRGNGQPGLEARLRAEMMAAANTIVAKIDSLQADVAKGQLNYGKLVGLLVGLGVLGGGAYKMLF